MYTFTHIHINLYSYIYTEYLTPFQLNLIKQTNNPNFPHSFIYSSHVYSVTK